MGYRCFHMLLQDNIVTSFSFSTNHYQYHNTRLNSKFKYPHKTPASLFTSSKNTTRSNKNSAISTERLRWYEGQIRISFVITTRTTKHVIDRSNIIHQSPTWTKILDLSHIGLDARDPETGLLPFQLAAMMPRLVPPTDDKADCQTTSTNGNEHDELESLTTCFRLLRMNPCLASGLAEIKPRGPQTSMEQQNMVSYKPRVTKLEEENEQLRQRVKELELQLASIQMVETDDDTNGCPSQWPILKKRKSQL